MGIDFNNAKKASPLEDAGDRTERIREALKKDIRNVVRHLFPKAIFTANDARIGDVYGTKGTSLSIALRPHDKAGMWIDHASSGDLGDVLTLWAAAMNISDFGKVLEECDAWLNGSVTPRGKEHALKAEKQKKEKAKDPDTKKVLDAEYLYTDIHGNKICTVFKYYVVDLEGNRVKKADGSDEKTFSIYRHADKKWSAPNPRPLYRLPDIVEFDDIVLVEGEKCADALAAMGIEATTASGGSNTKLDHTDWTPLAGKNVYLWADNDATGIKYMEDLQPVLEAIGCSVFHVPIPDDMPKGWDVADAIEEGRDVVQMLRDSLPADQQASGYAEHKRWVDINYQYEGEVIEDLLPRNGVATIFGESTAGKTFVVLDLSVRIARGDEFLGRETEPCGVLYCAFEGYQGVQKRIHAIKEIRGVRDIEFDILDSPWAINDEKQYSVFEAAIESYRKDFEKRGIRLGIVIIDTLTSATAGSDTNSQADVTAAMKRLKRTAYSMDLLILNVGHTGKDNARGMVGSFAYKSEADAFLHCQAETEEGTGKVLRRSLFVEKVKDGPANYVLADYGLEVVKVGEKPNGKDITTCLVNWYPPRTEHKSEGARLLEHAEKIREYLMTGAKTIQEVADYSTLSRQRSQEILSFLERSGKIVSKLIGKRRIYDVPETAGSEKIEQDQ